MKSESLISSDVTTNYSEIHSRFQLRLLDRKHGNTTTGVAPQVVPLPWHALKLQQLLCSHMQHDGTEQ